jgi:hypothetical protein
MPDDPFDTKVQLIAKLMTMLDILDSRERGIISEYFGLSGKPKTLEEIGSGLNLTKERVRQIKEKQVLNQRMVNTTPYVYGKVNRLYAFRPMLGLSKELAEKQNKNSVGVNAFAFIGPSLGFLKPNYVDIEYFDPTNPNVVISKSVGYNPEIYRFDQITGYSPFINGINETKIIGGMSVKLGTEFNWGYYSSDFKSIEVGVLVDWFPSRPELLHFIQNKIVYSSFYISFALGKNY